MPCGMQQIPDRCAKTTDFHAIHATGNLPVAIIVFTLECYAYMTSFPNSRHEPAARTALRQKTPGFLRDSIIAGVSIFLFAGIVICAVDYGFDTTRTKRSLNEIQSQAQYLASLVDLKAHAWLTQPQQ